MCASLTMFSVYEFNVLFTVMAYFNQIKRYFMLGNVKWPIFMIVTHLLDCVLCVRLGNYFLLCSGTACCVSFHARQGVGHLQASGTDVFGAQGTGTVRAGLSSVSPTPPLGQDVLCSMHRVCRCDRNPLFVPLLPWWTLFSIPAFFRWGSPDGPS